MGEPYIRQKSQSYARFKIDAQDLGRIGSSQFSIFDFITNSFSFSPKKRLLSVKLLELLSTKPSSFPEIVAYLQSRKSTVYLLCLSLERSGLIEKNKEKQYLLSSSFCNALRQYAEWWEKWVRSSAAAVHLTSSNHDNILRPA